MLIYFSFLPYTIQRYFVIQFLSYSKFSKYFLALKIRDRGKYINIKCIYVRVVYACVCVFSLYRRKMHAFIIRIELNSVYIFSATASKYHLNFGTFCKQETDLIAIFVADNHIIEKCKDVTFTMLFQIILSTKRSVFFISMLTVLSKFVPSFIS